MGAVALHEPNQVVATCSCVRYQVLNTTLGLVCIYGDCLGWRMCLWNILIQRLYCTNVSVCCVEAITKQIQVKKRCRLKEMLLCSVFFSSKPNPSAFCVVKHLNVLVLLFGHYYWQ